MPHRRTSRLSTSLSWALTAALVAGGAAALGVASPAVAAPAEPDCVSVPGVCTLVLDDLTDFAYWTVPAGVTDVTFTAVGASGGDAVAGDATPGAGGAVTARIATVPGTTYRANPGSAGGTGTTGGSGLSAGVSTGGFGGGGAGESGAGGGGGRSVLAVEDVVADDWVNLLVAGGGGGAGRGDGGAERGGDGGDGGQAGSPGGATSGGDTSGGTGKGGGAATATAGGPGGTATSGGVTRTGVSGRPLVGGGFGNPYAPGYVPFAAAAGGGGGHYGGGQGTTSFASLAGGGGGGGSSYAAPEVTRVVFSGGANPRTSPSGGNGYVLVAYEDPDVAPKPEDVYVAVGGEDTGDCATWATACETIWYAVRSGAPTVTVHMGPGDFPAGGTFGGADTGRDITVVGSPEGTRVGYGAYIWAGDTAVTLRDLTLTAAMACEGRMTLDRVLVTGNADFPYYGVNACGGTVEVRNSTITAPGITSGVHAEAGSVVTVRGSTIVNVAGDALQGAGGTITVANSILAGSGGAECTGTVVDGGHNLAEDTSCGFGATGSRDGVGDLALGSLDDHGGPTGTFRPAPGSPAINLVPAGVTGCPTAAGTERDQTGADRRQGPTCDAGALEQGGPVAVTFDSAGGSGVDAVQVGYDTAVAAPAEPTRARHAFVGWFDGATAYDFATPVLTDLTLTARWVSTDVAPSVTDDPDDVEVNAGADVTFVADASGSPAPTVQWQVDDGGGWADLAGATSRTLALDDVAVALDRHRYRAVFTNDVASVSSESATLTVRAPSTVRFEIGQGAAPIDVEVAYGATVTAPADPQAVGHTFAGWYDAETGGAEFDFSAPITADTTVHARWTTDRYPVTFDTRGGSAVAAQEVAFGSTVALPAEPTRPGYSFTGWFTSADGSTPYAFATLVTGPVTLFAQWTAAGDLTVDAQPVIVTAEHFRVHCAATAGTLRRCDAVVTVRRDGRTVVVARGSATTTGTTDASVRMTLTRAGKRLTRPALGGVRVQLRATGVLANGLTRHADRTALLFAPRQARRGPAAMFRADGARLTPAGKRFLDTIARQAEQVRLLTCIGHTARTGNRVGNKVAYALSRQRAKAACAYLVRRGVSVRTQVRVVGVGNTENRKGGKPSNRFVDVVVRH